ncbi:MAG: glycosyltransferase [Deltaproteobacteria bacterium]|nr:glycosyltransferase [Deltaproteobacteria bacterium]
METIIVVIMSLFLGFITLVVLFNFFAAPVIKNTDYRLRRRPLVSILIPARNEEANIGGCLSHVLNQSYSNFEVIVLDDQSEDDSYKIVAEMKKGHANLTLVRGKDLPKGWNGKNWACHQLSQKARGEIIIFVDADCTLAPWTIETALAMMERYGLDLLSSFPTQKLKGIAGYLLVPVMDWLLLSFLPLRMVYLSPHKSFVAANGQFMAFVRKRYDAIGGHKGVADQVVEDMELARAIKIRGFRMMTALGGPSISCSMYTSFGDAVRGFSKNFYPGFNTTPSRFSCMIAMFAFFYLLPFFLVFFYSGVLVPLGLICLQRLLLALTDRQNPITNCLLHPIQMVFMVVVGVNSMRVAEGKKIVWKGRRV